MWRVSNMVEWGRRFAALCALACVFGGSASLAAEEAAEEPAGAEREKQRELGYVLVGTSCAVGLGMLGAFWFIRRRRRDQALLGFEGFAPITERDFSTVPDEAEAPRPKERREATGLARLVCTGCERRFEPTVDFCYHDGLPLMQDTREAAQDAPVFKACEACGWEGEGDAHALCPNESCASEAGELVAIDPADTTRVRPAIPLTICPTCREYGAPGRAFCPNDGDVLTPLLNLRSTEFPARGFGPKRKVCPSCGTEHGGYASYCCNDGTRLVSLN